MDDDFFSNLQLDDDDPNKILAGILSPASAQVVEGAPPTSPAVSGPGQSTPRTGNLAVAPQQAQPRVSGPAMLPGIATKPENLVASTGALASPSSFGNRGGLRTIVRDNNGTPAAAIPGYKSRAQRSPDASTSTAVAPGQPQGTSSQQRWNRIVGNPGGGLAGTFAAQQQAYAARPQPGPAPTMPTSLASIPGYRPSVPSSILQGQPSGYDANGRPIFVGDLLGGRNTTIQRAQPGSYAPLQRRGSSVPPSTQGILPDGTYSPGFIPPSSILASMPSLPATASTVAPPAQQKFAQDQAALNRYQQSGSGIDQIKTPWKRDLARAGDIAETILAPGIERITPGTVGNNQRLQEIQQGRIANDQQQQQQAAALADTQSQMQYRQQEGARAAAQAQADLQTHTGGQPHKLTADDAALVGAPALEGETISNDAWQKMVSGVQRNTQSGKNNAANNATRVQTTGMRDATSTGNSERAHAGKGAGTPKPIPAAIRDRIESQKNTAISKAKAAYDQGDTDLNGYLTAWQQAQDDYEDRISAQTGQAVAHTDILRNVDAKGNWIGNKQPATVQPQAQQPANRPAFITRKGSAVALGDPVNVNGRKGTVTGFNPTTGKAQIRWEAAQ